MMESCSETLWNEEFRRCELVDIAERRKARLRHVRMDTYSIKER
jgi:hypothetical protein